MAAGSIGEDRRGGTLHRQARAGSRGSGFGTVATEFIGGDSASQRRGCRSGGEDADEAGGGAIAGHSRDICVNHAGSFRQWRLANLPASPCKAQAFSCGRFLGSRPRRPPFNVGGVRSTTCRATALIGANSTNNRGQCRDESGWRIAGWLRYSRARDWREEQLRARGEGVVLASHRLFGSGGGGWRDGWGRLCGSGQVVDAETGSAGIHPGGGSRGGRIAPRARDWREIHLCPRIRPAIRAPHRIAHSGGSFFPVIVPKICSCI